MTALGDGLGRVFNVIATATGADVPLTRATCVTFIAADPGSGDQVLTFTQTDSTGVLAEAPLNIFLAPTSEHPENLNSRIHAGPDIGGGWVEKARTADAVFTNADTTNDTVVITVRAEQLSDGYDRVQCTLTSGGGSLLALQHDLTVQRKPSNLASSLVA